MDTRRNYTPKTSNTPLQNEQNLNTPIEPVAPESVSYEEGYLHGRVAERSLDNQIEQDRSESTAARGLVLGIALASLVGLTAGVLFYLNQRDESPTPTQVVAPATPQSPNRETTIIERTTENTQRTTPANPASPATSQPPDIRVIIPTPVQQAPAPQNITPQRQPSVEEPGIRQPSTSEETAPRSSQNQTSTGTSTTTEPNTTNQSSRTQSQSQTTSDLSDTSTSKTTQPNASDRTSAQQSQNQPESTTSGSSSSSDR
jgi:hypothetical protein